MFHVCLICCFMFGSGSRHNDHEVAGVCVLLLLQQEENVRRKQPAPNQLEGKLSWEGNYVAQKEERAERPGAVKSRRHNPLGEARHYP